MFEKQQQPFVDLEWEGQSLGDRVTARGCPQLVTREPCFLSKALGRLFTERKDTVFKKFYL